MPQWRVGADGQPPHDPDLLVLDLDPGPPATIVECCRVALLLRERLAADGLTGVPEDQRLQGACSCTSPLRADAGRADQRLRQDARRGPRARRTRPRGEPDGQGRCAPARCSSTGRRTTAAKTTVAPYSLRARAAADGVDAADVGRGRGVPHRARTWSSPPPTCSTGSRRTATCSSRCWHDRRPRQRAGTHELPRARPGSARGRWVTDPRVVGDAPRAGPGCPARPVGPSCSARPARCSSRRATTPRRWTTSPSGRVSQARALPALPGQARPLPRAARRGHRRRWSRPCASALAEHHRQQAAGRRHDRRRYFDFVSDPGGAFRLVFESDLTSEPAVRERVDRRACRSAPSWSAR